MFKRIVILVFSICVVAVYSECQTPPPPTPIPQSASNSQPSNTIVLVKKTVGLLRVDYMKDGNQLESSGTCFFVFYEDSRLGDNRGFVYIVTNRHMAAPGVEDGNTYPIISTRLRLNLKNTGQGSEEGNIPIGGTVRWVFPDDPSVDLAVLPFAPDQDKYDYVSIPVSLFATHDVVETRGIAEGDNILFTGFFYQFPGLKKFQPIVREGILAMMPDENMQTTLKRPGHIYLGDVHVFGGNSGAPLFVNLAGFRGSGVLLGGPQYRLLGIISGYYHEDTNLNLSIATTYTGTVEQNSGIALVVPVDELKELLDTPTLQSERDSAIASMKAKN